jgi:RNA polymerase sigma factor (sigma-70 family)
MSERDAELVGCVRAGDKQAFATLFELHLPLMRRVTLRLVGTNGGLEDIIQEAAMQALLGLDSLRDPRQFGPWLAGIALNVARRSLKPAARSPASWEDLCGGRLVAELIDASPGPLDLVEGRELSSAVRAAVADLPHGQRAVVLLVYLSGLTYRETAAALGIEVGSVKTRLHKGRHNLQRRLQNLWMESEDLMTTTSVEQGMVEMRVADVRRNPPNADKPERSIILLADVSGTRHMPIWVGRWEGDSIAMLVESVKPPRPLTHAFAASLLKASGVRVTEVRIHHLADETFYAQVVLDGQKLVDSRPSDAIALALETTAPIYVAEPVLSAAEAAAKTRQFSPANVGIGATEIVNDLLEHWPHDPKPTKGQSRRES